MLERFPIFSSLRFKIVAAIALFFAALVVVDLLIFFNERAKAVSRRAHDLELLASLVAKEHRLITEDAAYIFANQELTDLDMMRAGEPVCTTALARIIQKLPNIEGLAILDSRGKLVCFPTPLNRQIDLASRAYFKRAVESKSLATGEFIFGNITGKPILSFGFPVFNDEQKLEFVVAAGRIVAWLGEAVEDAGMERGTVITLWDQRGRVLDTYPASAAEIGEPIPDSEAFAEALLDERGVIEVMSEGGAVDDCAYVRIPPREGNGLVTACASQDLFFAEFAQTQLTIFGLITAIFVSVAGALWYGFNLWVLRPLSALRAAMDDVEQGRPGIRVGSPRHSDEIKNVFEGFNQMAASLEDRERKLLTAYAEAQEFSYVVSHDLRSPLRGIHTIAGFLKEDLGDHPSDEVRLHIDRLQGRVTKMGAIIGGLLQYFEKSHEQLEFELVDTNRAIAEIVQLHEQEHVQFTIAEDLPVLETSREAFALIFRNLINNAVKHAHGAPVSIAVKVEHKAGRTIFRVSDDGPGIAPGDRDRVFKMLAGGSARHRTESSGMGLALVKRTVERLDGKVWIEDTTTGIGVVLCVALPNTRFDVLPASNDGSVLVGAAHREITAA